MAELKLEEVKKVLEGKLAELEGKVAELTSALENAFIEKAIDPPNAIEAIARVDHDIKQLRVDVGGHVQVYNKHIMDQHKPVKK